MVVVSDDPPRAIREVSGDAAVVFLGMVCPEPEQEERFYDTLETMTAGMDRVIFVHSAGNMSLDT